MLAIIGVAILLCLIHAGMVAMPMFSASEDNASRGASFIEVGKELMFFGAIVVTCYFAAGMGLAWIVVVGYLKLTGTKSRATETTHPAVTKKLDEGFALGELAELK